MEWWKTIPEAAKEYEREIRRGAMEMKEKFKGAYSLYGQDERVELEFLFFEEPSGRIRYDAFLDEEFIEEGHIDGDRTMDIIAEKCYKALQKTRKEEKK